MSYINEIVYDGKDVRAYADPDQYKTQLVKVADNASIGRYTAVSLNASTNVISAVTVTVPSGNPFFDNNIYNQMWNEAIWMNPYEAFDIVKRFDKEEKAAFKEMMLQVARKDMVAVRMDILKQTFDLVDIYEYE